MLDVVTGRYQPPTVYWFRGRKDGGFGPREVLQEEGKDTKFSMATTNLADLDQDGLLDLVIGDTSGRVLWSRNEGSATAPEFGPRQPLRTLDGGQVREVKVSHKSDALPVDWDGDGMLDLLVGDECTDVTFFRGLPVRDSSPGEPRFAAGVSLFTDLPVDPQDGYTEAKEKLGDHRAVPGYRVRLCATDWNDDGKLDLLLGTCETLPKTDGKGGGTTGHVWVLLRR